MIPTNKKTFRHYYSGQIGKRTNFQNRNMRIQVDIAKNETDTLKMTYFYKIQQIFVKQYCFLFLFLRFYFKYDIKTYLLCEY